MNKTPLILRQKIVMPKHSGNDSTSRRTTIACRSGIVANGYSNVAAGVDSEARRLVEAKYADQWNAASLARRWKLRRLIDAEITELAAKLMPNVSPESLF